MSTSLSVFSLSLICRGLIIDMQRQGLVTFPDQKVTSASNPLKPMFAFLVKNPLYLCLADDNFALRMNYAHITGDRPSGTELLTRKRYKIEKDLARFLEKTSPAGRPTSDSS